MNQPKDIIQLHQDIVQDYEKFVRSFIHIKNEDIRREIEKGIAEGAFWPEPLIVFNPTFKKGESIQSLCNRGVLHPTTGEIFFNYQLYQHQVEAIEKNNQGRDYVVTSGTGSGKSLTFLAPIFDYVVRVNTPKTIKAVIVYPMNALINSQEEEISKYQRDYETRTGKVFPITFSKYTGQETQTEKDGVLENKPDIILTNYMMLELLMTRPHEETLRQSIFENLKYLVLDELHTYRGRQGADVALLVARIRAAAKQTLRTIGTSATMASGGSSITEQKLAVRDTVLTILGGTFTQEDIIGEDLDRCFPWQGILPDRASLAETLQIPVDPHGSEAQLKNNPISIWLENKIALDEPEGVLARGKPRQLKDIALLLAEAAGVAAPVCQTYLQDYLNWSARINGDENRLSHTTYLPFKVHQFISQTSSVYVSLHQGEERKISLQPVFSENMKGKEVYLFPVVFSRTSGIEMICVARDENSKRLKSRDFKEVSPEEENRVDGYLIPELNPQEPLWDPDKDMELLPESFLKTDGHGQVKPTKIYEARMPQKIYYDGDGNFSALWRTGLVYEGWFMAVPLLFDPASGLVFEQRSSEGSKLTRLGSEGRSTSTTVLSFAVLKHLAEQGLERQFQKLLSFTDNRQDAALQAGHFNDFIKMARLRAAIYGAVKKYGELDYLELGNAMFDVLALQQGEYALRSSDFGFAREGNDNAFKMYLLYEALRDLQYSWKVILPNLEQCALLKIDYKHLQENCQEEAPWQEVPLFNQMTPAKRAEVVRQVLDFCRRAYALHSEKYYAKNNMKAHFTEMQEKLHGTWKAGLKNMDRSPYVVRYETVPFAGKDLVYSSSIGYTSALGKYLKEEARELGVALNQKAYLHFIRRLMDTMVNAQWLKSTLAKNKEGEPTMLYQLAVDQIIWKLGDQHTIITDKARTRSFKEGFEPRPNLYFQDLYRTDFSHMKPIRGNEHTGQLEHADRQQRENDFREGTDSVLFCSPTMELGIDISYLSVVHMRNVPPSTSNYAQRSGRAGRRGQAALVITSCSSYSSHDRHYFQNQQDMVAGVVVPPKLDLGNKELLKSHLHAIYLEKAGIYSLNSSIRDIIEKDNIETLPLQPEVWEKLQLSDTAKEEVKESFNKVIQDIKQRVPVDMPWLNDLWITNELEGAGKAFDGALDRWRVLYKEAIRLFNEALDEKRSGHYALGSPELKALDKQEHLAQKQIDILTNQGGREAVSEFYPYRYLAGEGYLPGYNFPRLPIRTFIEIGMGGEYISRRRFIALREFGPANTIYHKGDKYQIKQIMHTDIANHLEKARVCNSSGYFIEDNRAVIDVCPFSGVPLTSGANVTVLVDLLPMVECRAEVRERISCEEEERISRGYEVETYFSVPAGLETVQKARVIFDGLDYLKLSFIPAANLVMVNRKWRSAREEKFLINMRTGVWVGEKEVHLGKKGAGIQQEEHKRVLLYTHDTADALYIEPIKILKLEPAGVISLMYALKRAIEHIFQVESQEIDVIAMGDSKSPNILLYESAEGSLGVLSQFMADKRVFQRVVAEAFRLCRFEDPEYTGRASYDDLLSFYNQRYHEQLDRFLIHEALGILKDCEVELIKRGDLVGYDPQYQKLLQVMDVSSDMERQFLDYLYQHGLRLPTAAQKVVEGVYCRPDFYYEPRIHVFCDGSPHDDPRVKETDQNRRRQIRAKGGQVLVWHYTQKLADFIASYPDIFEKVR